MSIATGPSDSHLGRPMPLLTDLGSSTAPCAPMIESHPGHDRRDIVRRNLSPLVEHVPSCAIARSRLAASSNLDPRTPRPRCRHVRRRSPLTGYSRTRRGLVSETSRPCPSSARRKCRLRRSPRRNRRDVRFHSSNRRRCPGRGVHSRDVRDRAFPLQSVAASSCPDLPSAASTVRHCCPCATTTRHEKAPILSRRCELT